MIFAAGFRQKSVAVYRLILKSVKQLKQNLRFSNDDFLNAFLLLLSRPLIKLFVGKVGFTFGKF